MKNYVKVLYAFISVLVFLYLLLPDPEFPKPPDDALQSNEPGDTETELRRAYFTNYSREEVIQHYFHQLKDSKLGIQLPTLRLNYPPEDAQTLIRDQTRSTFLEELVHPFRESLFINGFKPIEKKDAIFIGGRNWEQKIIIRYVPSSKPIRLAVTSIAIVALWFVLGEWIGSMAGIREDLKRLIDKRWKK